MLRFEAGCSRLAGREADDSSRRTKRRRPEAEASGRLCLVAGARYARVCTLPVRLMLPVVGRVDVAAMAG